MTTILVDRRPERDTGSARTRTSTACRRMVPAFLLLGAIAISGCGLKGDLYLPDSQTPATPPAVQDDDPETEDDNAG